MIIDYAPPSPRANKCLSLTFAFCTVVAISDCIAGPSNQNNQFSSPAYKNNNSNSSSATVDVSDLYNRDSSHAVQQLRKRGFYQVGARLNKSWWLYSNTIQCIQLDIANGKVLAIAPKSSQDCHSTR